MRRSTRRDRSVRRPDGPPPKVPVGISSQEFWRAFDRLPKSEHDVVNYALNGPAVVEAWGAVCDRNPQVMR